MGIETEGAWVLSVSPREKNINELSRMRSAQEFRGTRTSQLDLLDFFLRNGVALGHGKQTEGVSYSRPGIAWYAPVGAGFRLSLGSGWQSHFSSAVVVVAHCE